MRSRVAVLALGLLMLTAMSPAIEAIAGCFELCPDETAGPDSCSADACCSCCVHSGPLFASLPIPEPDLRLSGETSPPDALPEPPPRCFDILHVPKQLLS